MIEVLAADSPELLTIVRELFAEYAAEQNFKICFEGFEQEMRSLPGVYAVPDGRLFLGKVDDAMGGCVAIRKHDDSTCEIKRLFVRPEYRGRKLGRILFEYAMVEAWHAGYRKIRLETTHSMERAMGLYRSMGFREVNPNPSGNDQVINMELENSESR